jgi:hypothetical protein
VKLLYEREGHCSVIHFSINPGVFDPLNHPLEIPLDRCESKKGVQRQSDTGLLFYHFSSVETPQHKTNSRAALTSSNLPTGVI